MITKFNTRDPSQEEIRRLFRYDSETGNLIWKTRPRSDFKNEQATGAWNTKFAGTVAGCVRKDGYSQIGVSGRLYQAHRLIWIFHNGPISEGMFIDHISGDTTDNSISNLRLATRAENGRNSRKRVDNTTGVKGICFDKHAGKYKAQIQINGMRIHLGYGSLAECAALYEQAANKYYGEFARHA